ncbi:nuclear transport factor 2 family protein [Rhodococcus globerulus]|uniref:nuclear transport factor 2 family protein n=1 Tax=Rhodococcus globerulus TaxID=33008 RepID=UPI001F1BEEDF|nr:nuclear transport factor 2 family protein [Rhodococcus globerulus]MCE4267532.1 nuclear transport factor 2 family protein [Rhodococcus globerulus]
MITESSVRALLSQWWIHYDEAELEPLLAVLHPDFRIISRSDSGRAVNESAIASDVQGLDQVRDWWGHHRMDGPFPIRHHLTNFLVISADRTSVTFAGNTVHSKVDEQRGAQPLVSARIAGEATMFEGALRLRRLETVLDKTASRTFVEAVGDAGPTLSNDRLDTSR